MWNNRAVTVGTAFAWLSLGALAVAILVAVQESGTPPGEATHADADAHLARAEQLFAAHQLAGAEHEYRAVLQWPKSGGYRYAMEKLGWVELGLQRYAEGLDTFSRVAAGTDGDVANVSVNYAAKIDFVVAYA